jgi:hypothetical protein
VSVSAACTWGDGPDVLVTIAAENKSRYRLRLYGHGGGSFGLTAAESRRLAAELLASADHADELNRAYGEQCRQESEQP